MNDFWDTIDRSAMGYLMRLTKRFVAVLLIVLIAGTAVDFLWDVDLFQISFFELLLLILGACLAYEVWEVSKDYRLPLYKIEGKQQWFWNILNRLLYAIGWGLYVAIGIYVISMIIYEITKDQVFADHDVSLTTFVVIFAYYLIVPLWQDYRLWRQSKI